RQYRRCTGGLWNKCFSAHGIAQDRSTAGNLCSCFRRIPELAYRGDNMKLVSYIEPGTDGNKASYGALDGDRLVDLSTREAPTLRGALATEGVEGLRQRLEARRKDAGVLATSVQLLPPIPDPEKILCIGLNYF